MFSKRTYTIIVVTFDSIARVDVLSGSSVEVVRSDRVSRSPQLELNEAVSAGFRLGAPQFGETFLLLDELWSGRVSLANEIVEAIDTDQLPQSLALEAEPKSGIPPFESRVGHSRVATLDGTKTWWVTQADTEQLQNVLSAVPTNGKLVGIAATSLEASLDDEEGSPPDASSSEAAETLAQTWLRRHLAEDGVPIIRLSNPNVLENHKGRLRVVSVLAALVICAAWHVRDSRELDHVTSELSQLVDRQKQVRIQLDEHSKRDHQLMQVKLQAAEDEAAALKRSREIRKTRFEHTSRRKRPVELLRALAVSSNEGHWIQRIELRLAQSVVSGVALEGASVARLAKRLESVLDSSKWLVQPATLSVNEATRLTRFEIAITSVHETLEHFTVLRDGATHVQ